MDKEKTKTVFRFYRDFKEVIALFPQIPADNQGWLCSSYMHLGEHGGADTFCVVRQTRPATLKEYRPLLKELKQLGYKPKIAKRCTLYDREQRRKV